MVKKSLEMMEMFHLIREKELSPNQFYLLCCLKENEASKFINVHQELRSLVTDGWITEDEHKVNYKLSVEAITFVNQVEALFSITKKKTNNQIMGQDYASKVLEFLDIFPKIKLPSGKFARSDKKNIEMALRWFIQTYSYDWTIILNATKMYVDDYERANYKYMQTSQYFIRKQNPDKSWASELANWCAQAESGPSDNQEKYFSEKVI
jgi:hypothetical protein